MQPVKQLLGRIASEHLCIPTLEIQRSDNLDFHNVSVWAVEALRAAFDTGCNSVEAEPIDIHDIAAKRQQIAVLWSVEDVQEVRPDLSGEQAWEVLQLISRQLDATLGVTWDTLEYAADSLFGDAPEEA